MLESVCDLLCKIPGVTVHECRQAPDEASIEFSVQFQQSTRDLQRACEASNVSIEPWERGVLVPGSYSIRAATNAPDGFSGLQLLGVHLAWHLHKVGILAAPEANKLLRAWNAAEVRA
jgi:hypothetical protein